MSRQTKQPARLMSERVLEGLEKVVSEQSGLVKGGYKELVEARAIARELIAHINALEEAAAQLT